MPASVSLYSRDALDCLLAPQVLDFGFPDHSACPLELLLQIVEAIRKWLSEDKDNVAVVHCLAGKGSSFA